MTTICYKDGVLAADGRITRGNVLMSDSYDKIEVMEGEGGTILGEEVLAYAVSGHATARTSIKHLLKAGLEKDTVLETSEGFSSIVVTKDRAYNIYKDDDSGEILFLEIPDGFPYSVGSGYVIGTYALNEGKDPVSAVLDAMKSDFNSGGEVTRYERPVS